MSSSAINAQLFQAKIGSIQNQADSSAVYSNGIWSFKNSTAVTSVTITDAGNVGIGTASPAERLDVNGRIRQEFQNAYVIKSGATEKYYYSNGASYNAFSANIMGFGTANTDPIAFATNNAERMRIDASGNIRIGTSSHLYAVGEKFSLLAPDNTTDAIAAWRPTRATGQHIFQNNTGGLAGYINWTGTTTTYFTTSDYRLKEDVKPIVGALSRIVALKPCTYKWKADSTDGEGFIAHELAEVCPLAVAGEKDEVHEDGSIKPQAIDPSKMIALLTAAIQELSAKVDAQAVEIAELKAKLP